MLRHRIHQGLVLVVREMVRNCDVEHHARVRDLQGFAALARELRDQGIGLGVRLGCRRFGCVAREQDILPPV